MEWPGPRAGRSMLLVGLALLVALAAQGPSLTSPFFLDDFLHLERARQLAPARLLSGWMLRASDLEAFWWVPPDVRISYFRPLVTLTMALNQRVCGSAPLGYHLTNVLLHLLCALLVYRIARRLPIDRRGAGPAALIFLLHPVPAGAIQWISARGDALMTAGYLLALGGYLDLRMRRGHRTANLILTPLAFIAALLSKESALSLPLLLVALEMIVLRPAEATRAIPKSARLAGLALLLAGTLYLLLRLPVLGADVPPSPYWMSLRAASVPDVLLQQLLYVLTCLFLLPVLPFHNLEAWRLHPELLAPMTALLGLLALTALRPSPRRRMQLFLAAWFFITLLPAAFLMMGQRFAYLPAAGFSLFVATALTGRAPRPTTEGAGGRVARIGLVIGLAACALVTFLQASLLRAVAVESDRMTRALLAAGGPAAGRAHLLVGNGWAPASLWVNPAARWLAGEAAPVITVLTLAPDLFPPAFRARHPFSGALVEWLARPISPGGAPAMVTIDSTTVDVRSRGAGLFDAPSLRFFLFGRTPGATGDIVRSKLLTAELVDVAGGSVRVIRFHVISPPHGRPARWLLQDDLSLRVVRD